MTDFYSREATSQVAVLARIFGGAGCPVDIRLAPTEAERRCREGQIPRCLHRYKFDAPYACIGVFDFVLDDWVAALIGKKVHMDCDVRGQGFALRIFAMCHRRNRQGAHGIPIQAAGIGQKGKRLKR